MKPLGRRAWVALVGLWGALAWLPGVPAAGSADSANRTEVELSTQDIGARQVALGDLVADAIRASAKADVALIPAAAFSELTVTIRTGTFTVTAVLKALEYKNETIALVKLTGEQIRAALEHGLYVYPKANSSFLQTSGLIVNIDPEAESERRITAIKVGGDPLVPGKAYTVAMPMTLANGALAYYRYWQKRDIDKDTEKTLENAVTSYLANHKTIGKGDDRLVAKSK